MLCSYSYSYLFLCLLTWALKSLTGALSIEFTLCQFSVHSIYLIPPGLDASPSQVPIGALNSPLKTHTPGSPSGQVCFGQASAEKFFECSEG